MKKLQQANVIFCFRSLRVTSRPPLYRGVTSGSPLNEYSFNKHYDTWKIKGVKTYKGDIQTTLKTSVKGGLDCQQGWSNCHPYLIKETIKERKKLDTLAHFDQFYKIYPRKKSKGQAKATWTKLTEQNKLPELSVLIKAIEYQKTGRDWRDNKYIPYPSTWLNAEGWKDEVIKPQQEVKDDATRFPTNR